MQRLPLELSTTKPEFEFNCDTECDDKHDEGQQNNDVSENVPKALLRSFVQTESLKTIPSNRLKMPPELIIKPVTHTSDNSSDNNNINKSDKSNSSQLFADLPPIICCGTENNGIKHAHSWHNFNKLIKQDHQDSAENLQLKLSLKKNIWSGTGEYMDNKSRPLSWGISMTDHGKPLRNTDKYEDLFIACSQKLTAWQRTIATGLADKSKKLSGNKVNKKNLTSLINLDKKFEKNQNFTGKINDEIIQIKNKNLTNKTTTAADTSNLSNLYCSTKNICNRKSTMNDAIIKNPQIKSNKFKTGGIVAKVVVQQPNKNKNKKTLGTTTPLLPPTFIKTLNGSKERNNNVTEFLENVKTKIKKKKTKQKK